jgi:aminopeptidase C
MSIPPAHGEELSPSLDRKLLKALQDELHASHEAHQQAIRCVVKAMTDELKSQTDAVQQGIASLFDEYRSSFPQVPTFLFDDEDNKYDENNEG